MATASAATNWYPQIGIITRKGVGANLLDKDIDVMMDRSNEIPIQGSRFFRKAQTDTDTYKEATVGNELEQPRIQEDTDEVAGAVPAPGFTISATIKVRRLAVKVTRSVTLMQRHQKALYMASGLMDSGKRNLEYAFSGMINNAFATNVGADGMYLIDSARPNENIMTGTWSNLETAADMTHSGVSTARVNMRKRTNSLGEPMPMKADLLVISADDQEEAFKILNSEKVNDNVLNAKSWNQGALVPFVWDYKTDTDSWFLFDESATEAQSGLIYIEKEAPTIYPSAPQDDVVFGEYLRMSYATAIGVPKNIQGNAGA